MSDMNVTTEIGVIITNQTARRIIYAIYVLALLTLGGIHVWFSSAAIADPQWLTQATSVLTYLGIPVGALGVANATNPKVVSVAPAITAMPNPDAGLTPAEPDTTA